MFNMVLFVVFPYVAVIVAIVFGISRYRNNRFSYSSLSSQFLENRTLFWGSVPWHYGIIILLTAHLLPLLFPSLWSDLLADRIRLYILEVAGLALALMTVLGMLLLVVRRLRSQRVLAVTTPADWLLLVTLLTQVAIGFWIALFYRWGSGWYLHTSVPWLLSLLVFQPQIQYVTALPWLVQFHLLTGFFIILLFPFTRLVHIVTYPLTYLWRPIQVVIWNRRPPPEVRDQGLR
ncbi:MAG: respiratory nitrate reductase subunit gamma [Caldilineales bacterium]|nr:respiratory nitrate reductase subunit gamma [Caldilineales bacterium]MCW5860140.1 respiratory nitrate reductase subunit gamma [Caldilineales bacterium]